MEKEVNSKIFLIAIIAIVIVVLVANNFNNLSGSAVAKSKMPYIFNEKVKCVFHDTTDKQECYLAGENKIGCTGIETCTVNVQGANGKKLTWKSSCGGYAYTIIDGVNDYAEFNCGIGFYKASWQCYDGYYIQASSKKPLTSETWNKYAEEDCIGHCYEDYSKCGVNSFGVL